jgi:hypothetical protein
MEEVGSSLIILSIQDGDTLIMKRRSPYCESAVPSRRLSEPAIFACSTQEMEARG